MMQLRLVSNRRLLQFAIDVLTLCGNFHALGHKGVARWCDAARHACSWVVYINACVPPQASHGNGYTPPSLDQTLTFPVDDPFINATAGLDDIVENTQVPSADVEAPTASLLQFTGAAVWHLAHPHNTLVPADSELGKQSVTGKIGQQQPGPSGRVPPGMVC